MRSTKRSKRLDLGPCSLNMLIHQNHSFFSKTSRRNRFIVRLSGAKVHASRGASSTEKGELPIGRPFRHAPQNGTLLGGSKKGAAAPFFFPSYRPAMPVGRGDFSER